MRFVPPLVCTGESSIWPNRGRNAGARKCGHARVTARESSAKDFRVALGANLARTGFGVFRCSAGAWRDGTVVRRADQRAADTTGPYGGRRFVAGSERTRRLAKGEQVRADVRRNPQKEP